MVIIALLVITTQSVGSADLQDLFSARVTAYIKIIKFIHARILEQNIVIAQLQPWRNYKKHARETKHAPADVAKLYAPITPIKDALVPVSIGMTHAEINREYISIASTVVLMEIV